MKINGKVSMNLCKLVMGIIWKEMFLLLIMKAYQLRSIPFWQDVIIYFITSSKVLLWAEMSCCSSTQLYQAIFIVAKWIFIALLHLSDSRYNRTKQKVFITLRTLVRVLLISQIFSQYLSFMVLWTLLKIMRWH